MKKTLILFTSYFLLSLPILGQFTQKPCKNCFIVMNSGDTVKCSIENQEDYSHLKKIRIQVKEEKEIRKVSMKNIQTLSVPGKFYEKVEFDNGNYLLQRITNGYVKLYLDFSFEWKGNLGNDPDAMVDVDAKDPDPEKIPVYHILIDGKVFSLSPDRFQLELAEHFNDFMELSYRLWSEDLAYADVKNVVKEYNHWKAEQEKEPLKDR